uniref:IVSP3-like protein n=1 Tax=Glypta fumiferanae TaxID=389681 RepID=A0A0F6Y990_9HYME|nr:IVSP3-like protein [Glypta fumiferanae]
MSFYDFKIKIRNSTDLKVHQHKFLALRPFLRAVPEDKQLFSMAEFDGNWTLRRILATWLHTHVAACLDDDLDMDNNRANLAIPKPGKHMYEFYTFLVKTNEIITDELYRGRYNGFQSENITFHIPADERGKTVSWKHLRTLCRLINMFNRMQLDNATFQAVLNKHTLEVERSLDVLQSTNSALMSLLSITNAGVSLNETAKIHMALDRLVHKPFGNSDERMNELFKLNKNQSFVFVRGVIDAAEEIFESICQYLLEKENTISDIINLMKARIPERVLRQTIWKNINVTPTREVHASDADFLHQRLQKIGSLAWEFNCRFLSQVNSNLSLSSAILKKIHIPEFNERRNALSVEEHNVEREMTDSGLDNVLHAHSIYSMSILLIFSSRTLVHCPCSSKTMEFVRNVFATCDDKKLREQSTANAKVFLFAAHEMSKFPFARPTERHNFRNMFTSYSQSYIFGRSMDAAFVPDHVNELSYVYALRDAGLEVDYANMLYLLLNTKKEKFIPDSLYAALFAAVNVSYRMNDDSNLHDSELLKRLENDISDGIKYRMSVYQPLTTFCIVYALRMAYFTQADVKAGHMIPIISLLDINTETEEYSITAASLRTFLNNLPIRPALSANLTAQPLESMKGVEIRALFKYFTLLTNIFLMEQTRAEYTIVDFIRSTSGV